MKKFDRLMLILMALLVVGLAATALIANGAGLKAPHLVAQEVGAWGPVEVAFDQKMQPGSVESRWQSDSRIAGHFRWKDQTMAFYPETAFTPGTTVTFRLAAGAQGENGQAIRQDARWQVSVRQAEVAYLSPVAEESEIWKAAQDGSGRIQLTHTGSKVYDFSVAASGAWLAYTVKNGQGGSDVWVIGRNGENSRKVADCGPDRCLQTSWSPDGAWLAYSRKSPVAAIQAKAPQPRIWTLELATGKTTPLFQDASIAGTSPSWSPDGKRLAFFDPAARVIHVLDKDTGKELMLQSELGVVGAWSADGQKLWYGDLVSSDSLPYGSAYVADVTMDQVTQLFTQLTDPVDTGVPEPAPGGEWIAVGWRFQGGSRSIQLVLVRPDGTGYQKITDEATYTHGAYSWDPVGARLLFQRVQIGSSQSRPEIMIWDRAANKTNLVVQDAALPEWLP